MKPDDVKQIIRGEYARAARQSQTGGSSCCAVGSVNVDFITEGHYTDEQKHALPQEAVAASLGCGNPTALTALKAGEVVLDLGSGGGIDVLLSAKRVAPDGKAYGLDFTDDMLALARENQRKAGITNAEFLKGDIEDVPLPDGSIDVIVSNCVINLATDKAKALREAFRVLRPGGRVAISDIVVRGDVPAEVRHSMELWAGCVAGALEEQRYRDLLAEAGFIDIEITPTRIYRTADAKEFLIGSGLDVDRVADQIDRRFMSAFVRATKPRANAIL